MEACHAAGCAGATRVLGAWPRDRGSDSLRLACLCGGAGRLFSVHGLAASTCVGTVSHEGGSRGAFEVRGVLDGARGQHPVSEDETVRPSVLVSAMCHVHVLSRFESCTPAGRAARLCSGFPAAALAGSVGAICSLRAPKLHPKGSQGHHPLRHYEGGTR